MRCRNSLANTNILLYKSLPVEIINQLFATTNNMDFLFKDFIDPIWSIWLKCSILIVVVLTEWIKIKCAT